MFKQVVAFDHSLILHQTAVPPATWNNVSLRIRVPKLLEMLLAAFISSKSRAPEVASELLHASRCQMQAYPGHGTARISFWLPDTIFWLL
jgi:hypothetical protein